MNLGLWQAGGAIRSDGLYVRRPADEILLQCLLQGELATVLAPRQMGKTSLRVRTMTRLEREGRRCAAVDLTALGTVGLDLEQWTLGLLDEIAVELGAPDPGPAWRAASALPPVRRFVDGLAKMMEGGPPTVVFLDEVDSVLALPFPADDLFAAIRAIYNRRDRPGWDRLCFCLLGVVAPQELMRDARRTPFNVGRAVVLEDFSAAECRAFLPLFHELGDGEALLESAYDQTRGHPYMMQRLGGALAAGGHASVEARSRVDAAVKLLFLNPGPMGDINLSSAARRLLLDRDRGGELLELYRRVWEGLSVSADDGQPAVLSLLLTGMVARRAAEGGAVLAVRNPIFAQVFDRAWIDHHQGRRELAERTSRWLVGGRRTDDLLRGSALTEAQAWAEGRANLAREEIAFLLASGEQARRDEEERAARARAEQLATHEAARRAETERHLVAQRGLNRRLFSALAVFGLALAAAVALYLQLRHAGRSLDEIQAARADAWLQSAEALRVVPGREADALRDALRALAWSRSMGQGQPPALSRALSLATAAARRRLRLAGHVGGANGLVFSADGTAIFSGGADGLLRRWDSASGARVATWSAECGAIRQLALSPSGAALAVACADGHVQVWEAETRRLAFSVFAHARGAESVRFLDEDRLLSAGYDATLRLWDARGGAQIRAFVGPTTIQDHPAALFSVAVSPDGTRVVGGAEDGAAWEWDLSSGAVVRSWDTGELPLYDVLYATKPDRLVAACGDGRVLVYNLSTGQAGPAWHAHADWAGQLLLLPDPGQIASVGADGAVRTWALDTGTQTSERGGHSGAITEIALSPDGARIATAGADGEVHVIGDGSRQASLVLRGHAQRDLDSTFLPDGRALTGNLDGTARLWDVRSGETVAVLSHPAPVTAVAGSARAIWTAAEDGRLRRWSPEGRLEAEWVIDSQIVQILPRGDGLVALTRPGLCYVLDGDLRITRLIRMRSPTLEARDLGGLSPDGRLLVAPADGSEAGVWDLASGARVLSLVGHEYPVRSALFSPDGRWIATASRDTTLRLWSPTTGAPGPVLRGHTTWVLDLAFSPDSARLVSGSLDGTLRLWRVPEGDNYAVYEDFLDPRWQRTDGQWVSSVAFSPDGARVLASGSDKVARIFEVSPESIRALACETLRGQPEGEGLDAACDALDGPSRP